jgi:hypothetical protein
MEFPYMVRGNLVIIGASAPKYRCPDGKIIDMVLTIADAARGSVEIEFAAHDDDTEEHGRLLHAYGVSLVPTPYSIDLAVYKQDAFLKSNREYIAIAEAVTKNYPELEKDTWPTQAREVRLWLDNPEAPTPWVDIAAAARGIDRIDYLQRSHAKASQFEAVSAYLTGLRQKYEDSIKAATTVAEVDAVVISYQLPPG